jgi:hypothetical protein
MYAGRFFSTFGRIQLYGEAFEIRLGTHPAQMIDVIEQPNVGTQGC